VVRVSEINVREGNIHGSNPQKKNLTNKKNTKEIKYSSRKKNTLI
jgi:hypothetical protein